MTEKKLTRIDYFNFLFIIFLIILFFRNILFTPENLIIGSQFCDLPAYFYPSRMFGFGLLKKLALPLWYPYSKCGFPFTGALQSAVFYPLNQLFLFLPIHWAFNLSYIIHLSLSGIFTYLLVKYITKNSISALVSSLIYTFCAFQILHIFSGNINIICSMAWTPLVFLLVHRATEERRPLFAVTAGIIFGIQILAGYIQYIFHLGIFILAYWAIKTIYQIIKYKREKIYILHYIKIPLLLFTIALGISAIQLLPAFELLVESIRQKISYELCSSYSLPPENLLTFILPALFGNDITVPFFGRWNIWETCTYIGIPALILVILAIIYKRGFYKNTFLSLTIISIILALGSYTPLFKLLYRYIPGFNLFRGNSKFFTFTSLFLAILAGLGLSVLINEFERLRKIKILIKTLFIILLIIFAALLFIILLSNNGVFYRLWLKFITTMYSLGEKTQSLPNPLDTDFFINSFLLAYRDIVKALSIAGLFIGIFILRLKDRISKLSFNLFVIIILIGNIWMFGQKYALGFNPRICHLDKETKEFLRAENTQPFRINYVGFQIWNLGTADGFEIIGGYEHAFPKRFSDLINLNEGLPLDTPQVLTLVNNVSHLTGLLNVKYYIIPKGTTIKTPELKLAFKGKKADIYEHPGTLPRVFITHKAKVLKNMGQIFDRLIDPEFNPRKEVILQENPNISLQETDKTEDAFITSYEPNRILISASLNSNGILVLSDNYFPGWEVYVDGKKDKIFIADYTLRGVALTKGSHNIEFIYRPKSFRYGLIISIITLIILVLYFCIRRKRR